MAQPYQAVDASSPGTSTPQTPLSPPSFPPSAMRRNSSHVSSPLSPHAQGVSRAGPSIFSMASTDAGSIPSTPRMPPQSRPVSFMGLQSAPSESAASGVDYPAPASSGSSHGLDPPLRPFGTGRRMGSSISGSSISGLRLRSAAGKSGGVHVSTKLKGPVEKPWLGKKDIKESWARWIILISIVIGAGLIGVICYFQYAGVPNPGKLCLIMEDNFDSLDYNTWHMEEQVSWENGNFDWTTKNERNAFVENNTLYIVPTLTTEVLTEEQILDGYTVDLTRDGSCTSDDQAKCVVSSNAGYNLIINPVQSARMTTVNSHSIAFGKVEVVAKMPTGDWLWPAIWMMPKDSAYGPWPISGEIDLAESRGNAASYQYRARDYISSAIHWGPLATLNRYWTTMGWLSKRRDYYNEGYNTYGLEWTDKYLMTYINNRNHPVYKIDFTKQSMWDKGDFPNQAQNGSNLVYVNNPWISSGNNSAPFDKDFFLIMNVAVGAQNGYFPDDMGDKPWIDGSNRAPFNFFNSTERWYSTWPEDPKERGMAVKSVKMWQKC